MNKPTILVPSPRQSLGTTCAIVASCERAHAVSGTFVALLEERCACGHELGDHGAQEPPRVRLRARREACPCLGWTAEQRAAGGAERPRLELVQGGKSICPACERTCRTGTLVTLLDPVARTSERKKVCSRCGATSGIVVVSPRQTPIVRDLKATARRDRAVDQVIRMLTTYARAALEESKRRESMGTAKELLQAEYQRGRGEGFEAAIELLRGPK